MNRFKTSSILFLVSFVLLSNHITSEVDDGAQHIIQEEEKPSFAKIVTNTISLLIRSRKSSWEKIRTIIHEVQLQVFHPNLDFRGDNEANGVGGKMKEAAEKSFGSSRVTVEESAKSAAQVIGEAVHKTAEKVKESVSHDNEEYSHDEL